MKQLKSNSKNLRNLFTQNITVKHIAEKIQYRNVRKDAEEVLAYMDTQDFDVLGVEENGEISGYVKKTELSTGQCGKYRKMLSISELVSDSTPLIDLLPILGKSSRIFILGGTSVTGIVTRGDLQKAPVRMFVFGLVTLLEMQMLRIIRIHYTGESWREEISSKRLEIAKKLFHDLEKRNEAIDLVDCLQFCDKRQIIVKNRDILENTGLKSKTSGEIFFKTVEKLRNNLAHSQDIISGFPSWIKVIELIRDIETVLVKLEVI